MVFCDLKANSKLANKFCKTKQIVWEVNGGMVSDSDSDSDEDV